MPITVAPASASARANCRWLFGKNGSTKTTFMPGMLVLARGSDPPEPPDGLRPLRLRRGGLGPASPGERPPGTRRAPLDGPMGLGRAHLTGGGAAGYSAGMTIVAFAAPYLGD